MSPRHGPASPGCREMFARLSEYLDGELDPGICEEIESHLGDCPPCQAFLESLRRTVDLTRDLPVADLPEDLTRDVVEAYRKMREERDD